MHGEEHREEGGEHRVQGEQGSEERSEGVGSGTGPGHALGAVPIVSLADVLTEDVVAAHLGALLRQEIADMYGPLLPLAVEPTKDAVMRVLRSGFFHQATLELSSTIGENGVGSILASSYGYAYRGEGLEAFLRGLREAKREP